MRPRPPLARAAVLFTVAAAAAACRRPPQAAPPAAPAPRALDAGPKGHCYWAAFRTALPPDSVAARSARAYTTLGLAGARWARLADTAWAEAGPTALAGGWDGVAPGVYAARVAAFRRGDTTFFRPFAAARAQGVSGADSARHSALQIPFCGAIGRTAQAGGTAPREEERDDSLPQWRRRP